jgi:hypothetical protein
MPCPHSLVFSLLISLYTFLPDACKSPDTLAQEVSVPHVSPCITYLMVSLEVGQAVAVNAHCVNIDIGSERVLFGMRVRASLYPARIHSCTCSSDSHMLASKPLSSIASIPRKALGIDELSFNTWLALFWGRLACLAASQRFGISIVDVPACFLGFRQLS